MKRGEERQWTDGKSRKERGKGRGLMKRRKDRGEKGKGAEERRKRAPPGDGRGQAERIGRMGKAGRSERKGKGVR